MNATFGGLSGMFLCFGIACLAGFIQRPVFAPKAFFTAIACFSLAGFLWRLS
jgi:hypothetical protein